MHSYFLAFRHNDKIKLFLDKLVQDLLKNESEPFDDTVRKKYLKTKFLMEILKTNEDIASDMDVLVLFDKQHQNSFGRLLAPEKNIINSNKLFEDYLIQHNFNNKINLFNSYINDNDSNDVWANSQSIIAAFHHQSKMVEQLKERIIQTEVNLLKLWVKNIESLLESLQIIKDTIDIVNIDQVKLLSSKNYDVHVLRMQTSLNMAKIKCLNLFKQIYTNENIEQLTNIKSVLQHKFNKLQSQKNKYTNTLEVYQNLGSEFKQLAISYESLKNDIEREQYAIDCVLGKHLNNKK